MPNEREEAYAEWAQHMENVQRAHPETDAKLSTEWWKPAVDFPLDIKVSRREHCSCLSDGPLTLPVR